MLFDVKDNNYAFAFLRASHSGCENRQRRMWSRCIFLNLLINTPSSRGHGGIGGRSIFIVWHLRARKQNLSDLKIDCQSILKKPELFELLSRRPVIFGGGVKDAENTVKKQEVPVP